jgi:PhnB protein
MKISPMLSVRRGAQAVEFYKKAFGAKELFRIESATGEVVANLSVGESDFWVADESAEYKNFSPESIGGATTRMILIVDDPDGAFQNAIAAGGISVSPVENREYGWRQGRVLDPYGHHWEIGKPI